MSNPLGRFSDDLADDDMATVQLLQAPLKIWQRAAEHHDELMREMSLLALSPTKPDLPTRLVTLVDVLGRRYGAANGRPDGEREASLAQGLDRIDLTYEVPRSLAASALRMRALLDEAEEYCRTDLLTMAQPQVQADFARWYIDQFVRQCAGEPATPWPGPWT
ncbi:MAG: hypothetical protein JWM02_934 [Frankiales bacterium]|nr:hypothetical protein [Frankiales bacterium]